MYMVSVSEWIFVRKKKQVINKSIGTCIMAPTTKSIQIATHITLHCITWKQKPDSNHLQWNQSRLMSSCFQTLWHLISLLFIRGAASLTWFEPNRLGWWIKSFQILILTKAITEKPFHRTCSFSADEWIFQAIYVKYFSALLHKEATDRFIQFPLRSVSLHSNKQNRIKCFSLLARKKFLFIIRLEIWIPNKENRWKIRRKHGTHRQWWRVVPLPVAFYSNKTFQIKKKQKRIFYIESNFK